MGQKHLALFYLSLKFSRWHHFILLVIGLSGVPSLMPLGTFPEGKVDNK
jgi:hypothetical protein